MVWFGGLGGWRFGIPGISLMKGIGIYLGAPLVHPKPPGPKPPMFNVQFRGLACYGQRFGLPQKIGGEEGIGKPTVQHGNPQIGRGGG